jgi:hypothetical protein
MCQVDQDLADTWFGCVNLFNLGGDAARIIVYNGLVP